VRPQLTDLTLQPTRICVNAVFNNAIPEALKDQVVRTILVNLSNEEPRLGQMLEGTTGRITPELDINTMTGKEGLDEDFNEIAARGVVRPWMDGKIEETDASYYSLFANPSSFQASGPGGQKLDVKFVITVLVFGASTEVSPSVTTQATVKPQEFVPPPPTLQLPVEPSMSTTRSLANIFFAPARVFDSFRDVTTFTPAAIRFLVAAPIIVVAIVAYNVIYLARIGPQNIVRASMEASPKFAGLPSEQKERIRQVQESPALIAITRAIGFGKLILLTLASLPLGALIYWLGGLIFKSKIKYMQALLVWTYAVFAPTVLWLLANTLVLLIHPPTTSMGIVTGANGVVHANLGALFDVTTLPIPVYVVALSEFDLFAFYGLGLAMFGLRKVARIPWLGSIGIVIFVWMLGVVWHIGNAGLVNAIMK